MDPAADEEQQQLLQLGQTLPLHIHETVLPIVADEIASSAAELHSQVDGTRQGLLQSAALRRSTVLAPLLKQQLVARALQLQRRRAELVRQLQRQARHWRSTAPVGASTGDASRRRGGPGPAAAGGAGADDGSESAGALRETWAMLRDAFRYEESRAHLVQAPLCPSTAALRAVLTEAVDGCEKGLHRRVARLVAGSDGGGGSSSTSAAAAVELGSSAKGDRDGAVGGGAEDAIEVALQLLLRHARYTPTAAKAREPRSGASSPAPAVSADTCSPPAGLAGVCDVDVYSDDVEEPAHGAEEDRQLGRQAAEALHSMTSSPTAPLPAPTCAWLRVPGILSLSQYCAEPPWVGDLAAQRYTEARERKKHSSSSSSGGGEVGYMSRHVQLGEQDGGGGGGDASSAASAERRETRYEAGYTAPTPTALAMMPPLGPMFCTAAAGATASSASSGGSGESAAGQAMRRATGPDARLAPGELRGDRDAVGALAQEEERAWLARVVVQCVSAGVDAAWAEVEESVVAPFCALRRRRTGASGGGETDGVDVDEDNDEEEEAMSQFMEVLRVRYAVELAAQVLAARHATELLLDSEDGVIFTHTRLVSLVVGGSGATAAAAAAAPAATTMPHAGRPTPAITCAVLSLPGVAEVFYVAAYCTGAALLRDATAAMAAGRHHSRGSAAAATAASSSPPPPPPPQLCVVDVDAESEDDGDDVALHLSPSVDAARASELVDEQDPAAQQLAALQTWAALFEREHLAAAMDSAASTATPWTTGAAALHASWSLAPYYRLWLYLWEYVLDVVAVAPTPPASFTLRGDSSGRHQRAHQRGAAGLAELRVASRTARRWMEKSIRASLQQGCAEAGLLISCAAPSLSTSRPAACLEAFLSAEMTSQLLRATAAQARHALLQVSGVGTANQPASAESVHLRG
ncbi:hypothetical protein NESM_000487100 [Novymonas esmeraldas]|uniref:Uncharacterized protein n=1 Tax=Novymonas esmeraldas TaxID=1808958 RepID=A0AAW0EPE1_9TRYP